MFDTHKFFGVNIFFSILVFAIAINAETGKDLNYSTNFKSGATFSKSANNLPETVIITITPQIAIMDNPKIFINNSSPQELYKPNQLFFYPPPASTNPNILKIDLKFNRNSIYKSKVYFIDKTKIKNKIELPVFKKITDADLEFAQAIAKFINFLADTQPITKEYFYNQTNNFLKCFTGYETNENIFSKFDQIDADEMNRFFYEINQNIIADKQNKYLSSVKFIFNTAAELHYFFELYKMHTSADKLYIFTMADTTKIINSIVNIIKNFQTFKEIFFEQ